MPTDAELRLKKELAQALRDRDDARDRVKGLTEERDRLRDRLASKKAPAPAPAEPDRGMKIRTQVLQGNVSRLQKEADKLRERLKTAIGRLAASEERERQQATTIRKLADRLGGS